MSWKPTDPSLFFSKKDPQDVRLGDCVYSFTQPLNGETADLLIWGYPDHEGIQLNGGRTGAAEAPSQIRKVFYKMTPHVLLPNQPRLLDLGDVDIGLSLADRHQAGLAKAQMATESGAAWISLGGGHDYGYPDGAGFLRAQIKKGLRPLVINLDAHLDVRPTLNGLNSGTPFYRLLNEFGGQFDFFEMGLQPHCNSRAHWDWALAKGARLIPLSEIEAKGFLSSLKDHLSAFHGQPLWLSFDMDAVTSTEAPGCSQSWTTGLHTQDLMSAFSWWMDHFDFQALSIYEVSPPLDSDLRTAKLAAQFMHRFLSLHLEKGNP